MIRTIQSLKKIHIVWLSLILDTIAIVCAIGWVLIQDLIKFPKILNDFILSFLFLLIGSTGLLYVWKREMPGLIAGTTIHGIVPVIVGTIIFLISIVFSLLYLYIGGIH